MEFNFSYEDYETSYKTYSEDEGVHREFKQACFEEGWRAYKDFYCCCYIFHHTVNHGKNYVFCTFPQFVSYITETCKILGITLCYITKTDQEYHVYFRMPANDRYALYASTYLRYIYEWPYSIFTYCALESRSLFPELNILQLVSLYTACFKADERDIHNIGRNGILFPILSIKNQFNFLHNTFNGFFREIPIPNDDYLITAESLSKFNLKSLQIINFSLTAILRKVYEKYYKCLHCWK